MHKCMKCGTGQLLRKPLPDTTTAYWWHELSTAVLPTRRGATLPIAKAVGPGGRVVALDGQPAMLGWLEGRLRAEGVRNVRPLLGELGGGVPLGEGAPEVGKGGFDRAVLAMVLGEARDRAGALRELRGALKPGGVLSVTGILGDPHHLGASTVLKEAEAAGFRLVGRLGSFPAYTLNFEKEPRFALWPSL
jgi:SAM-dependent methyltransferase